MAVIPTFQRSRSLPTSTRVGSPTFVPATTELKQSADKFFDTGLAVVDKVETQQAEAELTTATTTATISLDELDTKLSTSDPRAVDSEFETGSAEIYQKAIAGLGRKAKEAFDRKFQILSAKTLINARHSAKARFNDQKVGELTIGLDALSRSADPFKPGGASAMKSTMADGLNAIDRAISSGYVKASAGAKLALKFRGDMSENVVTRWMNNQTESTMMNAFREMDKGSFQNKDVEAAWSVLDESKKKTLTAQAINNVSKMMTFNDKEQKRKDDTLKAAGKTLMIEFYKTETTEDRRSAILTELAKNKTIQVGTYNTMLKDQQGRTDRFDNTRESQELRSRIFKTPHLVTHEQIINSKLSDVNALLTIHNTQVTQRNTQRFNIAREIIRASSAFVPSNMSEARIKGETFNYAQHEIWETLLIEQTEAHDKKKAYDPVARVKQLIKEYRTEDIATGDKAAAAIKQLNTLKIYSTDDLNRYLATKDPTVGHRNNIMRWFREAGY